MFDCAFLDTDCTREDANIVITPVAYDGTASYGKGTRKGPKIIFDAYQQLDYMEPRFSARHDNLRVYLNAPLALGESDDDNAIGETIRTGLVHTFREALEKWQTPALLGGEHSCSLGAIEACAEHAGEIGVLQIDAHMDLREAYEGYTYSHASVMRNVLSRCPGVTRLVQVGIRDWCEEEQAVVHQERGRVAVLRDADFFARLDEGMSARKQFEEAVALLPDKVYVSFDIDGLDPKLCPGTGTPVPGGLGFNQAVMLLQVLAESGKRVVGFDLVEVGPSPDGSEWDANVGARMLYRLCLCAISSQS